MKKSPNEKIRKRFLKKMELETNSLKKKRLGSIEKNHEKYGFAGPCMKACKAMKEIYQPSAQALKFATTKHKVPATEAWARTEVNNITW